MPRCDFISYMWQEFLAAEGKQLEDGTRDDPTLDRFEAEIAKYRAVQEEIQALPTSATLGYIKIDAKPIKQALTTWVTKWIYLFTHYLQIKVGRSTSLAFNNSRYFCSDTHLWQKASCPHLRWTTAAA